MPRPFDVLTVVYGRPLLFTADEPLELALERVAIGLREVSFSQALPPHSPGGGLSGAKQAAAPTPR